MTNEFHDEMTLASRAIDLGEQALSLGLIPSFVVRHFPDSRQFFIPDMIESDVLTPEEAYLKLKQMVERSSS